MNRHQAIRDVEAKMLEAVDRLKQMWVDDEMPPPAYLRLLSDTHAALLKSLDKVPEGQEELSPQEALIAVRQLQERLARAAQEDAALAAELEQDALGALKCDGSA